MAKFVNCFGGPLLIDLVAVFVNDRGGMWQAIPATGNFLPVWRVKPNGSGLRASLRVADDYNAT